MEKNKFWMALGVQVNEGGGNIALFESTDLTTWQLKNNILSTNLGDFCECPNIFRINNQEVIIVGFEKNNIYRTIYSIGKLNYHIELFKEKQHFKDVDLGFDFYAPQVMNDGRRILLIAWIGPGDGSYLQLQPTVREKWANLLTIPRELTIKNNRLYQYPAKELEKTNKLK